MKPGDRVRYSDLFLSYIQSVRDTLKDDRGTVLHIDYWYRNGVFVTVQWDCYHTPSMVRIENLQLAEPTS